MTNVEIQDTLIKDAYCLTDNNKYYIIYGSPSTHFWVIMVIPFALILNTIFVSMSRGFLKSVVKSKHIESFGECTSRVFLN